METRDRKIAAFYQLLDKWSRARDADLFLWRLLARPFGGRAGQPSFWGSLGGLGGNGTLFGCVPLHLIIIRTIATKSWYTVYFG